MSRPCACDRVKPGGYTPDQCRPCWLFHNDPAYRALWGGAVGDVPAPLARSLPCVYLGPVLDRASCPCPAHWVRACEAHTMTTLTRCKECPDYEPP